MSDRLTKQWTANSEGAFGATGAKGDRGEDFLAEVFNQWEWEYTIHRGMQSKTNQVKGVDLEFRKPSWANSYTCDVKANLDQYGTFFVETDDSGWLFNSNKTSDRIWHVNPDTGWMAWYGRDEMKSFIESNNLRNTGLAKITVQMRPSFITRRRVEVKKPTAVFEDIPY